MTAPVRKSRREGISVGVGFPGASGAVTERSFGIAAAAGFGSDATGSAATGERDSSTAGGDGVFSGARFFLNGFFFATQLISRTPGRSPMEQRISMDYETYSRLEQDFDTLTLQTEEVTL